MNGRALYTVEPYRPGQPEAHADQMFHVDADGPLEAAQRVLKEPLTTHGDAERLRCRVWRLDDEFRPISIMLFAKS